MFARIVPVLYLVFGLFVAAQHGYFANVDTAGRVLSAVLAVVLWPLVVLGVHLNIA